MQKPILCCIQIMSRFFSVNIVCSVTVIYQMNWVGEAFIKMYDLLMNFHKKFSSLFRMTKNDTNMCEPTISRVERKGKYNGKL